MNLLPVDGKDKFLMWFSAFSEMSIPIIKEVFKILLGILFVQIAYSHTRSLWKWVLLSANRKPILQDWPLEEDLLLDKKEIFIIIFSGILKAGLQSSLGKIWRNEDFLCATYVSMGTKLLLIMDTAARTPVCTCELESIHSATLELSHIFFKFSPVMVFLSNATLNSIFFLPPWNVFLWILWNNLLSFTSCLYGCMFVTLYPRLNKAVWFWKTFESCWGFILLKRRVTLEPKCLLWGLLISGFLWFHKLQC